MVFQVASKDTQGSLSGVPGVLSKILPNGGLIFASSGSPQYLEVGEPKIFPGHIHVPALASFVCADPAHRV